MLLINRQVESGRWCNVHIECEIGQLVQELKGGGGTNPAWVSQYFYVLKNWGGVFIPLRTLIGSVSNKTASLTRLFLPEFYKT